MPSKPLGVVESAFRCPSRPGLTPKDLHHHLNTVEALLNTLNTPDLCPGPAALDKINASLR
jgi:hypothetical protein